MTDQTTQATFSINAQYIKDMSFEGPANPADVVTNEAPKIDVNVTAQTRPLDKNVFEVVLNTSAQATVQVTTIVKSSKRPVVGDVYGCGIDVPGYLRAP